MFEFTEVCNETKTRFSTSQWMENSDQYSYALPLNFPRNIHTTSTMHYLVRTCDECLYFSEKMAAEFDRQRQHSETLVNQVQTKCCRFSTELNNLTVVFVSQKESQRNKVSYPV